MFVIFQRGSGPPLSPLWIRPCDIRTSILCCRRLRPSASAIHVVCVVCADRLEQSFVMMKSAIMLSKAQLVFHIFADKEFKPEFKNTVCSLLATRPTCQPINSVTGLRMALCVLTLKAPPIICSRRQFQILPLFQK